MCIPISKLLMLLIVATISKLDVKKAFEYYVYETFPWKSNGHFNVKWIST